MTIETAVSRYLEEDLRLRPGSSREAFRRWLSFFFGYCRREGVEELAGITPELVRGYQLRLHWEPGPSGRLYAANTIDLALRTLRHFLAWARERKLLLVDPGGNLVLPRVRRKLPRVLTVTEAQALLSAPSPHTAIGVRDRAFLELLYGTGLRKGEALALDVEDVDFVDSVLTVRVAKGNSARQLPIGSTLASALELYVETARPKLANIEETALFVTQLGARPSVPWVDKTLEKYAEQAELGFRVGAHALRHAFATHLLEGGADLREIQVFLGHRRLRSTSIYASLRPVELVSEYRRTHPRAERHPEP